MAGGVPTIVKSEDELGKKWDRCLADSLLKLGGGLAVGVVVSVVLAKRRSWPMWLGSGVGLGMAYANCQHELQQPFLLHGKKMRRQADDPSSDYMVIVNNR